MLIIKSFNLFFFFLHIVVLFVYLFADFTDYLICICSTVYACVCKKIQISWWVFFLVKENWVLGCGFESVIGSYFGNGGWKCH